MADRYRIILSPRAARELDDIFEYISGQSPDNAAPVVDRILTSIAGLEQLPARFKVERHVRKLNYVVHSMVVGPFLVFYRVDEGREAVWILCIQHGARRRPRSFE